MFVEINGFILNTDNINNIFIDTETYSHISFYLEYTGYDVCCYFKEDQTPTIIKSFYLTEEDIENIKMSEYPKENRDKKIKELSKQAQKYLKEVQHTLNRAIS